MATVDPAVLDGCRAAHRAVLTTLAGLDDEAVAGPSRLPGWTRGHVLTHLARNADSHVRALTGAASGRHVDRYPGGPEQRDAEIEAGRARPVAEQVADVATSIERLEAAWASMPVAAWEQRGTLMGAAEPVARLPWKRWREVELHRFDLDLGATEDDWSPAYVRRELVEAEMAWRASHAMGMTGLPRAALDLPPPVRLAWLVGRREVVGLEAPPKWL